MQSHEERTEAIKAAMKRHTMLTLDAAKTATIPDGCDNFHQHATDIGDTWDKLAMSGQIKKVSPTVKLFVWVGP